MEHPVRQLTPAEYPEYLRQIPSPPKTLYARGSWPSPDTKYLAVVGSRALTRYGKEACDYLISGLSGYPVSIVSGLALGTDAAAHRAALAAGLHTIAVPGSGLDDSVIAPRTNLGLAREILKTGGLLLSEHEPLHKPYPHDFPSRNRIMSGLAQAVLMVEAGERSGTLITARLAAEYNRELLCVPHRIRDVNGAGAHQFLRLGATLVSEPAHILEALGIEPGQEGPGERRAEHPFSEREQSIMSLLQEPLPKDELIRRSGLPASEALTVLVTLELKGFVEERFGAWHRI